MGNEIRHKTSKWGVAIYRQAYKYKGEVQHSRTYYYRPSVAGEAHAFALGADKAKAAKLAERIYLFLQDQCNTLEGAIELFSPRKAARAAAAKLVKVTPATIGDVLAIYRKEFKRWVSAGSANSNEKKLFLAIRRAEAEHKGDEFVSQSGKRNFDFSPWEKLRVSSLSANTLEDMQSSFLNGTDDLEEELTAKINANSTMAMARSVFAPKPYKFYKSRGLVLPDRDAWSFLKVEPFPRAEKFRQLSPANIIKRVFEQSAALKKSDPDVYRALLMCLHFSCRISEAGNAKWAWFRVTEPIAFEIPSVDGDFVPKWGKGRRILIQRWVYDELLAMRTSESPYVLQGDERERLTIKGTSGAIFRRLITWLQKNGVSERQPCHTMRAWWFSSKVPLDGLLAAQQQGGHRKPETTSKSYADSEMPDELLELWKPGWDEQEKTGKAHHRKSG
jgi:integrase